MNPSLPGIESLIQNGPLARPQKIVVFGPNGVGKSTLASQFPSPLFLDTEDGSLRLNVSRIRALDSDSFHSGLRALTKSGKLEFQTLVVDTADMAEKYIRDRILRIHRMNAIEDFGYGKGWTFLREEFEKLLSELDRLIARGIHVTVIGHSIVKRYQPPLAETGYDRYQLRLYEANSNRLMEWADAVLFVNWDSRVAESKDGKPRGVGGRVRVIHTQHSAGWDAKLRIDLPEKLECSFDAIRPLFDEQRKEEKQESAAADASSGQTSAPLPSRNPELYDQLLGAIGGMEADGVRGYLASRKLIPEDGFVGDLSANQARWIILHADKFRAQVAKFAKEPF